jgi:hypothetical protein
MKNVKPRYYVYSILLLLIIVNFAGLVLLWHHDRARLRALDSQVNILAGNQAASHGPTYREVTIAPSEKAVYLPLAKLKLSDSKLAEGLAYNYTDPYTVPGDKKVFPANLSISTHDLAANAASTTQQFDCTEVAYSDFVTPSYPLNPMWKLDGSTKLSDGRTMNIYYAPSIPGCNSSWQLNKVDAKSIADALKKASSY